MSCQTMSLRQLVDECDFRDEAFKQHVSDWMRLNMPGFPLGLLQTEGDDVYERWEILPDPRFVVHPKEWSVWSCDTCGEEFEEKPKECCLTDDLEEPEPSSFTEGFEEAFIIEDTQTGNYIDSDTLYRDLSVSPDGDDAPTKEGKAYYWIEEDEATSVVDALNQEAMNESQSGFPWAWGWAHIPDDVITDEDLQAAGFTVATYIGGSGDASFDDEYRLAGIDASGYSFRPTHYARLVAIVCERLNWTVSTDRGQCFISTANNTLEALAAVNLEE